MAASPVVRPACRLVTPLRKRRMAVRSAWYAVAIASRLIFPTVRSRSKSANLS
ncbi:Uncharacterised protein [Vibrio cholerae]|nr:Uncharacterised protein [Vibrio cholerae]